MNSAEQGTQKARKISQEFEAKVDGIDWGAEWPAICDQLIDAAFIARRESIRQEFHKQLWMVAAVSGWASVGMIIAESAL